MNSQASSALNAQLANQPTRGHGQAGLGGQRAAPLNLGRPVNVTAEDSKAPLDTQPQLSNPQLMAFLRQFEATTREDRLRAAQARSLAEAKTDIIIASMAAEVSALKSTIVNDRRLAAIKAHATPGGRVASAVSASLALLLGWFQPGSEERCRTS